MSSRAKRLSLYSALVILSVVLDQLSKVFARTMLSDGKAHSFIPGLVDLRLIYNSGAAFSMGEGHGLLFVVFAVVVLVGSLIFVYKSELPLWLVAPVACVAGGGVGNMIDRICAGQVTDFFSLSFFNFPIFNVADIFVSLGVVCALIAFVIWDRRLEKAGFNQ